MKMFLLILIGYAFTIYNLMSIFVLCRSNGSILRKGFEFYRIRDGSYSTITEDDLIFLDEYPNNSKQMFQIDLLWRCYDTKCIGMKCKRYQKCINRLKRRLLIAYFNYIYDNALMLCTFYLLYTYY
jgi:hypothetical protein